MLEHPGIFGDCHPAEESRLARSRPEWKRSCYGRVGLARSRLLSRNGSPRRQVLPGPSEFHQTRHDQTADQETHPPGQVGIKLAFMGSATFALPSLNRLFEHGYDLAGVITQPDKPGGRGHALQAAPVKKGAFELHLPIYQPASLKTVETRALIETLEADMIVVVAYGKILPPWLLRLPRYGCINLHGSILP